MAQTSIPAMYADLNRFGQSQEYERALKVANKILQESPTELAAFQCKIVSLIKLDRFNDALTAIHKDKNFPSGVQFEKAYCEYRLNRTQEALTTLQSTENLDNRCKELLAQVQYRLEQYSACHKLYKDLVKNSTDDFDEERETNLAAVLGSLQLWSHEDVDDPGLREITYELCYNYSCYLLGRGDFKGAEEKLRKAEVLCKRSFAEDPDATEEEVEEELAIIRVQLAYILQKSGRPQEALAMYNQVLKTRPSEAGIMAVLCNNVVTLNKDQNVFDSKKKMKVAMADNLKHKLSSAQKQSINLNQCLLHMYTSQADQCHQLAAKLKEQYPELDTPVLIEAAQYVKEKQTPKAIECLQKYAKTHPDQSLTLQLAIVQLHLSQGEVYKACDALKGLGDLQYKPGVISALVTLYQSQEDREAASDVLNAAVAWYKKHKPKSEEILMLMRSNASFQLKNGQPKLAAQMLEELKKADPADPRVVAQLIAAYSQFDPEKAHSISKDLPSVEEIARSVDVDALETAFSTLGPKYMKKTQKTEPSPGPSGDMLMQIKKKKKKRKTKLPKGYDPDVIPDPERWLPRKERSYYRGKRKDKKKDIGKGTQGATAAAMNEMDASKSSPVSGGETGSPRPGTATTASPSPGASAASTPGPGPQQQGPRQQKPAQAQKKKKKKGGSKW